MESQNRIYKGHRIVLDSREPEPELRIDDEQVAYGQLPDGQFFLYDYAYDWANDLMDLAERWIDYRANADRIRRATHGN
jgi:hypothetical protein